MAVSPGPRKRLADYGLNSERLLWPTKGPYAKGPGVFERELGVEDLWGESSKLWGES
jgi:hypothetical protein